jgi:hypothetical protein
MPASGVAILVIVVGIVIPLVLAHHISARRHVYALAKDTVKSPTNLRNDHKGS